MSVIYGTTAEPIRNPAPSSEKEAILRYLERVASDCAAFAEGGDSGWLREQVAPIGVAKGIRDGRHLEDPIG